MAPMMQRRSANLDDEDDDGPYDPRYPGQRVVADGGRVRVPVMLTDGMPDWMPPRRAVFDARNHRPHYADLSDAALQDGLRRAEAAYEAHNRWLEDAWRGPSNPPPPGPRPGESARDAYIRNLQSAYRTPPGQVVSDPDGEDDDPRAKANAIEAQRRRWTAEIPAKDAALADRDIAYGEYLDYLQNAWKRPCGVIAGGRR